ncbi:hypothetical protein ON010_g1168 [Phytophthora cinnamomi]|nr:hypothetical protein ON010_g1168 [Phytophthora cinnamomi]
MTRREAPATFLFAGLISAQVGYSIPDNVKVPAAHAVKTWTKATNNVFRELGEELSQGHGLEEAEQEVTGIMRNDPDLAKCWEHKVYNEVCSYRQRYR